MSDAKSLSSAGEAGGRASRDAAVFAVLPTVLDGLAVFYAVLAASHLLFLESLARLEMSALASVTAIGLLFLRLRTDSGAIREPSAHRIAVLVALLALANALAHMAVTEDLRQTTNVLLLAIAVGCLFLSWFWLGVVLAATVVGWAVTAWLFLPDVAWAHYGYALFIAVVVSVLVHFVRMGQHQRMEELRALEARGAAEIKERAALQGTMLDVSLDAIVTIDAAGVVVAFNRAAEQTFGYTAEQAIGKPMAELIIPPALRQAHHMGLRRYLETGESRVLGRRIELSAIRASGEEFPVEVAIMPVDIPGRTLFTAYLRDIGARREVELALRLRERAIESSAEGIAISDARRPGNPFVYVNSGFERLTGYRRDEVLGKSFDVLFGGATSSTAVGEMRAALREERAYAGELVSYRKDGTPFWNLASITPVRNAEGEVVNFVSVQTDITERKAGETELARAKEAAEAASEAKSRFLANVSHEIRTPLNGVIGMTGLLLDTALAPLQRRYAERVRQSGELLLRLINDLLDFSKIEAGHLAMEDMPFAVRPLMEQVQAPFLPMAERKGIVLRCRVGAEVPPVVRGDPGRIHQILNNLIGNAVKFTEAGRIDVGVDLAGEEDGRVVLRFEVSDTGSGIPAAAKARLFDAFTQADSSTTRTHGGTGLGLAIVKELVQMFDGEVDVESTPGEGSRFWFTARLGTVAAEELESVEWREPEVGPDPDRRAPLRPHRILVAEDNAINQEVVTAMLEQFGQRADVVGDGVEALEAIERAPYDLVLMDCQMPRMDGFLAAQTIRSREAGQSRIPIVAMTAYAIKGTREKCLASGMDDYIAKPVQLEELRVALVRWLEDSRAGADPPRRTESPGAEDAVDPKVLDSLRTLASRGRPDLVERLVARFLDDTPAALAEMREAERRGEIDTIARLAHDLKSNSGNLGARGLSRLCAELQEQARAAHPERLAVLLDETAREFDRVREALAERKPGRDARTPD